MDIRKNLEEVRRRIAQAAERGGRSSLEVIIVAVGKTMDAATIRSGFEAGLRDFGENRVQEARDKFPQLADLSPQPTWHLVGHLQSNKVKQALQLFQVIHSVDSVHLAEVINRQAGRPVPVFLEVNMAGETSKFGFNPPEVLSAAESIARLPNLQLQGLMTVAPMVSDPEEVRPVFRRLRELRDRLGLPHLSMGMTDDFEVAVEEGATLVRIGRAIFGERKEVV